MYILQFNSGQQKLDQTVHLCSLIWSSLSTNAWKFLPVISGPKQGKIIHQQLKVPIQGFSLKDLQTGQIAYQADLRASPGPDSVLLQATDNYNVLTMLVEIDIRAKVIIFIFD